MVTREPVEPESSCAVCHRPTVACVCDRIVRYETKRRIVILQHPQEQDALLGSAQLLVASLPKAQIVVGLSWRNFAQVLGEDDVDPRRWAVLFPDKEASGDQVTGRRGVTLEPGHVVIPGAVCAMIPVTAGDVVTAAFTSLGSVTARFEADHA